MIDPRKALALLVGATAIAPPLAELAAVAAIDARVARCDDGTSTCGGVEAVDLDAGGLRVVGARARRRGFLIEADAVEIRPDPSGVMVHVDGLAVRKADATAADTVPTVPTAPSTAAPTRHRASSPRLDIRVTAAAFGEVQLPTMHGATVTLHDPVVQWQPQQPLVLQTGATIEHPRWGRAQTVGRVRASVLRGPLRAHVEGAWSLGAAPAVAVVADVARTGAVARLDDGSGGTMRVEVFRDAPTRLVADARAFALDRLGDAVSGIAAARGVITSEATVDGVVDVVLDRPGSDSARVHLDGATVEGLVIDHRKVSREPVRLGTLVAHGDAFVRGDEAQGQVTLAHGGAQLHVAAARTSERFEASMELPRLDCQGLLDALPRGMAGVLEGTRLAGTIEGRFELSLSLAELVQARAAGELPPDTAPPGEVDLAFPMLQSCTVVADAAAVDLAAMRGPYRHRWVDDRGRPHERVMAAGASGYAPLTTVPYVARAFVTLEDTRFWQHDGFDREHIHKAFWHDIVVGRVARGASTITQQAARNLWLGVDRSISRKLQEAFLAARLEAALPKSRILELYLNVIELGPAIHGIEDAAQYHFGKPAADLTIIEALHLASMAPAPRALSKRFASGEVDDPWLADLRNQIRRMYIHGWITAPQMYEAMRQPLRLRKHV